METEPNSITAYETLIGILEATKHKALKSAQRDSLVNEITTSTYQTGSYQVFVTESGFVADIVLTIRDSFYLFVSFLDNHTVMLGANHRLNEAPQDLQSLIDSKLLDQIKYNATIGQDYGRFPQNRGKTLTAWNFHSNLIYLAR